jgi:ceramide glucosyltransferase
MIARLPIAVSAALPLLRWLGLFAAAAGCLYALTACVALLTRRQGAELKHRRLKPVTVLKPLCGLDANLYECLKSFFAQRYPDMQLVFGVADPQDPALAVVRRLQGEFPQVEVSLLVDATRHGNNPKVSNLINMLRCARHDWLVIADSDIRVAPDYLQRVAAELDHEDVGIVTCAYTGRPAANLWSRLGAEFINGWFTPSVHVADLFGSRAFAFGATIAIRRAVLTAIGGLHAIADHMADDYRLGELTRALGLRTHLSAVLVETMVSEDTFRVLISHQLRWLRTIRGVRPVSFALAGLSFSIPLAILGAIAACFDPIALAILGLVVAIRVLISATLRKPRSWRAALLLVPCSDLLSFVLWCRGFFGRHVIWRSASFSIDPGGLATQYPQPGS